jgi:hypothetical protein
MIVEDFRICPYDFPAGAFFRPSVFESPAAMGAESGFVSTLMFNAMSCAVSCSERR